MNKTKKEFYTLPVVCQNCDNEWVKKIPFGEDFEECGLGWGRRVASYGSGADAVFPKCPKCGSGKVIKKKEKKENVS